LTDLFHCRTLVPAGPKITSKSRVALKDHEDRDDEAPPSVDVTLGDTWQIYEIKLASFPPVDLDALHVPLSFVFERDRGPVAFSVRSARYVASP
jgi:hypothetical protein